MKGLSPTQRTLRALREQGRVAAIVERFNPYGGPLIPATGRRVGVRQDLFGWVDIIALDPQGFIGIQSCGASFSEHRKKLLGECAPQVREWLRTPGGHAELWGWRKVKRRLPSGEWGKGEFWEPRVERITLAQLTGFEVHNETEAEQA